MDKKRVLRQTDHLTRPPRLEGKIKEAMMQPMRKSKRKTSKSSASRGGLALKMGEKSMQSISLVQKRVEKLVAGLRSLAGPEHSSTLKCEIEIAKTTRHHRHGNVFRAEVNFSIAGKLFRAVALGETPSAALDIVHGKIKKELIRVKHKMRSRARREGAYIKKSVLLR